jgi:galactokinase
VLDQFSVLFGEADHAFVLDCRDLEHELLPLGTPAPAIIVCDSRTRSARRSSTTSESVEQRMESCPYATLRSTSFEMPGTASTRWPGSAPGTS